MDPSSLEAGLSGPKPKSRKRTYMFAGLALIILIIVGVGVGVAVSRLSSDDDSSSDSTPASEDTNPSSDRASAAPDTSAPSEEVEDQGTEDGEETSDDSMPDESEDGMGETEVDPDGLAAEGPIGTTAGDTVPDDSAPDGADASGPVDVPSETMDGPTGAPLPVDGAAAPDPVDVVTPVGDVPLAGAPPEQEPLPVAPLPVEPLPVMPNPNASVPSAGPPAASPPSTMLPNASVPDVAPVIVPEVPAPAPAVEPAPAPAPPPAPELFTLGPPNKWTKLTDVPLFMGEVSAAILTLNAVDYLVIVGQHPRKDPNYERDDGVTMIYNIAEGTWIRGSKRPSVGDHHASEVIDNKMYLFGGLKLGQKDVQVGELIETNAGVDIKWTVKGSLPVPNGSACSALINGLVYLCGGVNEENTDTITDCAAYDPVAETWDTSIQDMPAGKGRNHAASCTDGKNFYVLGGRDGKNIVGEGFADTQIYTPGVGWSFGEPMPLGRGGTGKAVYHDGKCYVFGGEVWENIAPSDALKVNELRTVYSVDVYDIATNSWSQAADMPNGLHGMFPIKYGGVVFVTAGGTEAEYSQSKFHQAYNLPL